MDLMSFLENKDIVIKHKQILILCIDACLYEGKVKMSNVVRFKYK